SAARAIDAANAGVPERRMAGARGEPAARISHSTPGEAVDLGKFFRADDVGDGEPGDRAAARSDPLDRRARRAGVATRTRARQTLGLPDAGTRPRRVRALLVQPARLA